MSDSGHSSEVKESWLDRWWQLLLIGYGLVFILTLAMWHS